ncbi:MAG: PspC domain-containing protein [Candidatus Edwardsbacteria bacterium]|nr:PspC domain-containing protein [Candidatus Edwardsbacteria bacterium]
MTKKLYRSRTNRMIAGVCGGLGEYFEVDPTMVRLLAAVAGLVTFGTAAVVYLIAWVIIPDQPAA